MVSEHLTMGQILGRWVVQEERCGSGFLEAHILAWLDFLEEKEGQSLNLSSDEFLGRGTA